jgi:hypothetical protein
MIPAGGEAFLREDPYQTVETATEIGKLALFSAG